MIGTFFGLALATCGYMYPVVRYLRRQSAAQGVDDLTNKTLRRMLLAAGLSGVALLGTWGATQWAPSWADKLTGGDPDVGAKYFTQLASALGAVVGTILAALAGDWFGRRWTYAAMCVLSVISLLALYQGPAVYDASFLIRSFAVGIFTAAFYGWLPLYLPELFRTSVRATGQGFGFNFGRILAAVGTLQAGNLFAAQVNTLRSRICRRLSARLLTDEWHLRFRAAADLLRSGNTKDNRCRISLLLLPDRVRICRIRSDRTDLSDH